MKNDHSMATGICIFAVCGGIAQHCGLISGGSAKNILNTKWNETLSSGLHALGQIAEYVSLAIIAVAFLSLLIFLITKFILDHKFIDLKLWQKQIDENKDTKVRYEFLLQQEQKQRSEIKNLNESLDAFRFKLQNLESSAPDVISNAILKMKGKDDKI